MHEASIGDVSSCGGWFIYRKKNTLSTDAWNRDSDLSLRCSGGKIAKVGLSRHHVEELGSREFGVAV